MKQSSPAPDRLLLAALAAFARAGFEGASTHAIAKVAGTPQGLIRHHFGSKEGLWLAVIERGLERAIRELDELEADTGLTVAGWVAIVERHLALAQVLVHALFEGGSRAQAAAERAAPVVDRLRALQRVGHPHADDLLLPMWMLASLGGPLLREATGAAAGAGPRELDRLLSWLCSASEPAGFGPFAVQSARARLRG